MSQKKKLIFFLIFFLLSFALFSFYQKFFKKNIEAEIKTEKVITQEEENNYNSNIIKDVKYVSKDTKGNEYIIEAEQGEIDYSDPNIIFLKNVNALIKLNTSEIVKITSKFGKYNLNNYDTVFSKNVKIDYLDNKIEGEYLDFSLERNSMIISRQVVYSNLENILKADVIELNIDTKDTKIFMYEKNKTVNIKNKN